jgi:NADPH-dependent 2,4-dienoyl-CoA reductase/sulfur reductase-like enzyme
MNDIFDVLIVGMGPSGLAAAIELSRLGVHVGIIDDNPEPGGQVYRQMSPEFKITDHGFMGIKHKKGQQLIDDFNAIRNRCTIYSNAYVWGCFFGNSLSLIRDNKISLVKYKKLLLCEGAMERPLPFPGWTLPGVMTLGGLQRLVLHERVLPGQRILLAGCSPLLLPVAANITKAGGHVLAMCDSVPFQRYWKLIPELLKQRELTHEAFSYYLSVLKGRVPFLRPSAVVSASGQTRVEAVRVAKLDPSGSPVAGTGKDFQVDILGISHGFLPSGRLARLMGCSHSYDATQRYWRPEVDDYMCSSQEDIYIAGDSSGVDGRDAAVIKGRLAALHMASKLDRISTSRLKQQAHGLRKDYARIQRYATALNQVFALPLGALDVMDRDTIVCRCEQVTLGDVLDGIEKGYRNINEIKRTRAGMGICQGRMCESVVAQIMLHNGVPVEEIGYLNLRSPLSPIPFSSFEDYANATVGTG